MDFQFCYARDILQDKTLINNIEIPREKFNLHFQGHTIKQSLKEIMTIFDVLQHKQLGNS